MNAKAVELKNNPLTYHYEETPLSYVGRFTLSRADMETISRFHSVVGAILNITPFLSVAYQANIFFTSFF